MKSGKKKMVYGLTAVALTALLTSVPRVVRAMEAEDAPESVTIDSLSKLYGPVEFDHAAHTVMARCVDCHHHTAGTEILDPNCIRCHSKSAEAQTVSCGDCHAAEPFSVKNLQALDNPDIYHIDKPGLKGAYHLNCIGCHQQVSGPTGCQDCHAMAEAGEKLFHTGPFKPAGTAGGHHGDH